MHGDDARDPWLPGHEAVLQAFAEHAMSLESAMMKFGQALAMSMPGGS